MGRIGHGYGSEWHLLRWMGRHRDNLDKQVLERVGLPKATLRWLDFPLTSAGHETEWKGLGFISDPDVRRTWERFWPQGSGIPNWDAVGQIVHGHTREWLLVEAKAHTGEIKSDCRAKAKRSREMIESAFAQTKLALGVAAEHDWMQGHYQHANRLATLYFLEAHMVAARLLFVFFTGDRLPRRTAAPTTVCPSSAEEWEPVLLEQSKHLGLPSRHPLAHRVHRLFLPVSGTPVEL